MSGAAANPSTQNGYNYVNNNPVNLNDPYGLSAWSTFQSLTGLDKLENAVAARCTDWGAIGRTGAMAVLNMSMFIPGVGEADAAAQVAVRGLAGAARVLKAERVASVGSRSAPLLSREEMSVLGNQATEINGRLFSGHALNGMQNAGIYPTVVENTIRVGKIVPSSQPGTIRIYDRVNDITAIIGKGNGNVITTFYGK